MNVASLEWVASLLVVSAFFFLISGLRARQALLAACSLGFFAAQSPQWAGCVYLIAFFLIGYGVAHQLAKKPSQALLVAYLVLLIGSFVFIKQYSFLTGLLPASLFEYKVVVVGISYMLFRQIHLVVDAYQGQIQQLTFWNYANYQLNLFGLQAGPIQRYQDFVEGWTTLQPVYTDRKEILKAYLRVFMGVVKVIGIGSLCFSLYDRVMAQFLGGEPGGQTIVLFVASLYLFTAYLYCNFSGYCDIVIAGGGLLGLRMPENFNFPFVARNISDLWTRWHRTLGFWIRDYLFTPIFKSCVERWPSRATTFSFIAYFIAFCIAGLWHGSTWNFLVFGLLHGGAVAAAKIWEMILVRRRGRPGLKIYLQNPRIKFVAMVMTFHYFAFSLIFWFHGLDQCMVILRKLGAALGLA